MKTHHSFVSLLLVIFAVSTPCRADLFVERLLVKAGVDVQSSGEPDITSYDFNMPLEGPFDVPLLRTATVTTPSNLGLALQTKGGFFRDFASFSGGFSSGGTSRTTEASTSLQVVVGTTTTNTPLVLEFNFLGAHVSGSAYYGAGNAFAEVHQTVRGFRGLAATNIWDLRARIELLGGAWTNYIYLTDPRQIGKPQVTLTPHHYDTGFTTGLEVELAPLYSQLDFGLLQPGELFTLEYEATAEVRGTLPSGGTMQAEVIDPFTLGGPVPVPLSLQGLTLPPAPVIAPRLSIALVDNEHARLSWPTNAAGYALQFTTSLPAQGWSTITNAPAVVGDRFALMVETTDGSRFYRLR